MKINEVIVEGVWDNLKTAGQTFKQGASAVGQGIKQRAGAVANKVGQTYQQTRQAQQQRFAQAAASQNLTPAQLRTQNVGTFTGDLAKTIKAASSSPSYFTQATNTVPKNTIPIGSTVETELGNFKMTAQGWATEANKPVTDSNIIDNINAKYYQTNPQPTQPVDLTTIQPATRPGTATSAEQAKLQQKIQAALAAQGK